MAHKAHEGRRAAGTSSKYALAISASVNDSNPIAAELRHLNETMIKWVRSRQAQCDSLAFVYVAAPEQMEDILAKTLELVDQDIPEAKLIRTRTVEVIFLDKAGKPYKQFSLGQ